MPRRQPATVMVVGLRPAPAERQKPDWKSGHPKMLLISHTLTYHTYKDTHTPYAASYALRLVDGATKYQPKVKNGRRKIPQSHLAVRL